MATYRVLSLDLRTGTRVAEISLSDLKFGAKLNDVGVLSGRLHLPSPTSAAARARASALVDAVDECRRQLVVERDGVIVWCGIVWGAPYDDDSQTIDVSAAETWSYFRHRYINTRGGYDFWDQFDIVRSLIDLLTSQTGGDIGVTVETHDSGVTRYRVYEPWELKQLGEAIEQLSAVNDGFDFAIDPYWDPATGELVKVLRLHYPRRGRRYNETGLVFELGRNVTSFKWPSDGTRAANQILAVGAGEGSSMLRVTRTDSAQIQPLSSGGPGYPLLQDVVTYKDVSVFSTLVGHATQALATRSRPVVLPEVSVRADSDPIFGSYIVGDAARFIVPPHVSPRFPDGLDTYYRIVGWDVSVGDEGDESVKLTFGEEPSA